MRSGRSMFATLRHYVTNVWGCLRGRGQADELNHALKQELNACSSKVAALEQQLKAARREVEQWKERSHTQDVEMEALKQRQRQMLTALRNVVYEAWPLQLSILDSVQLGNSTPINEFAHLKALLQELRRVHHAKWFRRYDEEVLSNAIGLATYRLARRLGEEGEAPKTLIKEIAHHLNKNCQHVQIKNFSLETFFDATYHDVPEGHTAVAPNTPVRVGSFCILDQDSNEVIYRAVVTH
ncbi:MAG: hypothetical protein KatS3mg042_1374 [Rhodothermaceae bacterium]|nr:MAG: hypothetical protein KatS3mg042_1374 [Rhodothermaceae bacterium]